MSWARTVFRAQALAEMKRRRKGERAPRVARTKEGFTFSWIARALKEACRWKPWQHSVGAPLPIKDCMTRRERGVDRRSGFWGKVAT